MKHSDSRSFLPAALLIAGLALGACAQAENGARKGTGRNGDNVLHLASADGGKVVSLACTATEDLLEVSVPSFSPVGSAEEMGLGVDGDAHLLVVDPASGRVVGRGPIPAAFLAGLVGAREVRVVYAAQRMDGIMPPDPDAATRFLAACRSDRPFFN